MICAAEKHTIYLGLDTDCFNIITGSILNTLWTGDADLRLYITTVQDG